MPTSLFHPLIESWFESRFGRPTEPQRLGWPQIAAGRNTLIAAPTGSGKTLAAFLVCIDRLFRNWLAGRLRDQIEVVYVSPLKALSNDIRRNLEDPLEEISQVAMSAGFLPPPIRTMVRTGDTPAAERQAMLRRPPHILVTTPESLYLLLTSEKARRRLSSVHTVIVDEIHALARDKRGSHLTLSLERLDALCERRPVRIGLSATQRPIERIAQFLVGASQVDEDGQADCAVIDSGHVRTLDIDVDVPPSELSAVCSHEQWGEVYDRLTELIQSHRSTLIFVNTRRLAERVALHLAETLGPDAVASHHGSLSRQVRQRAELRLKSGELKAIVATASLEMGIDIGYIDLVCQIGSPRSIATFLQRVGRSGHSLGVVPKGRLFPLTRDELLECLALIRAVRSGELDQIEIPEAPLDILAQQIVAAVACEAWDERELFDLFRRAWPFRELSWEDYQEVVGMLSYGMSPGLRRGAYLHRDAIGGKLQARRGARIAAITSGGAIPEMGDYRVMAEPEHVFVGTVNEDFALESLAGDVFVLGNTSWRIRYVRGGEVVVRDAEGAPPTIPFWIGEAPGRTWELSEEISLLRAEIADRLVSAERDLVRGTNNSLSLPGRGPGRGSTRNDTDLTSDNPRDISTTPVLERTDRNVCATGDNVCATSDFQSPSSADTRQRHIEAATAAWLAEACQVAPWAAEQAAHYIAAQQAALGLVPTSKQIVFERFFDESGGMQLVIHAPLGARINRAWGLSLRKRFCRSFDFELQASADDDGIVLSLGPQHSFPVHDLFGMLTSQNGEALLKQALLVAPLFQTRWRWNVSRALAVLRHQGGKRVPPHLQRFKAEDLLASVFPETVGCLENHSGDVPIPDHPMVRQTVHDCLHEAMDVRRWLAVLDRIAAGEVELVARDTREPSPFCYELLNANPYAFLDQAPLEERRTRAVSSRRSFAASDVRDLARLDPDAIAQVRQQAWPVVRDAEELHDALMGLVTVTAAETKVWERWLEQLAAAGRVARAARSDGQQIVFAAEQWPIIRAAYDGIEATPPVQLPEQLERQLERSEAWVELVRGRIHYAGPVTARHLARQLALETSQVEASLESLEGLGVVLRGRFTDAARSATNGKPAEADQWCDRRLLARIHRLTLDGLRRQIQPVEPEVFLRFLVRHHRLTPPRRLRGPAGLRLVIEQLQGFQCSAGAWESQVLTGRLELYDPQWLDGLAMSGEVTWGRLRRPTRDAQARPSGAPLTRNAPIALVLRENLPWLIHRSSDGEVSTRGPAEAVLEALQQRGALFFQELVAASGLLASQAEDALRELAALGLVTCDGFASVRAVVAGRHGRPTRRNGRGGSRKEISAGAGRWSLFPGALAPAEDEQAAEAWCWQLLKRYGVVFRDLVAREAAAPPWGDLARVYRRLELRGEVRGGRFVAKVAGEQFASEEAVAQLRQVRDDPPGDEPWVVISAADPLNLAGIITPGQKVPASHTAALVLWQGRWIAARSGGRTEFFEEVPLALHADMSRALQRGAGCGMRDAGGENDDGAVHKSLGHRSGNKDGSSDPSAAGRSDRTYEGIGFESIDARLREDQPNDLPASSALRKRL